MPDNARVTSQPAPGGEVEGAAAIPAEGEGEGGGLHIGLLDVLCVGPIVLAIVWSYAGIPLLPSLIDSHPVLLSALRGSSSAMIETGARVRLGDVPLWQAVLAPLPVLFFSDPFFYWAGRRYGRRMLNALAAQDDKQRRRIARMERAFARFGVWTIVLAYFLPLPSPLLYMAAGETRMPIALFVVADLSGTLMWVGLHLGLGWSLGSSADNVAKAIGRYGLWLTLGLVAVVLVLSFRRAARVARQG